MSPDPPAEFDVWRLGGHRHDADRALPRASSNVVDRTNDTVEILITNRIYLGEKNFRDIAVPAAHPAIIDIEQFELAQRILGKRSTRSGNAHTADSSRLRDELAAVTPEMKDTSAAIDRYLIAFEKGTLDDEDSHVRDRLATLKTQSKQLRGRKAQLELELDQPPQTLSPADQTKIRDRTKEILSSGATNARKAMCEAMIKEIVIIADDTVRPIFKLPIADDDEGLVLDGPALFDSEHAVRALPTMVGP